MNRSGLGSGQLGRFSYAGLLRSRAQGNVYQEEKQVT